MSKRKLASGTTKIIIATLFISILLLSTGCKSIQEAAREGDIKHIKKLLAFGVNINSRTYGGDRGTALHRACSAGQVETVKFLIEKGADVNIGDEASILPIHRAAESGHSDIVKILLDNGAFPNPELGYTNKVPLNYAVRGGSIEVAKVLLDNGADINIKGIDEYTPLGTAVVAQQMEMVKFLLLNGADVNTKAIYDRTPLFSAYANKDVEIGRILLENGADPSVGEQVPQSFIEKLRE